MMNIGGKLALPVTNGAMNKIALKWREWFLVQVGSKGE
jgi:hypothetical protein